MDQPKYTTLMDALKSVPDPRHARGKRYSWSFLLALVASAMASGQQTGHAIAQWVALHAEELVLHLRPGRGRAPSESTLQRVLRRVDLPALEARLGEYGIRVWTRMQPAGTITTSSGQRLQGQAVDGKELRGVRAHGQPLTLVSLVRHGDGVILAQCAVEAQSNEITAVPRLLSGRDLTGTVTTMDALLAQRSLAEQIRLLNGHYLMVVKPNQPELYRAIAQLFDQSPWLVQEKAEEYRVHRTTNKGHGRLERRTLESSNSLWQYLDWPGAQQVMRRRCERANLKTGEHSTEVTYAVTSLPWAEVGVAQLETLWRGHWTIENRVHYIRDVTMGEDRCQMHIGNTPQALAALRNAILNLLRKEGWLNIADALRYYGASVQRALNLIGAAPL